MVTTHFKLLWNGLISDYSTVPLTLTDYMINIKYVLKIRKQEGNR